MQSTGGEPGLRNEQAVSSEDYYEHPHYELEHTAYLNQAHGSNNEFKKSTITYARV
jgi:hypothetical protein